MNIKSTTRSAILPPAKYGLRLFLLISILFVSTATKAQYPAFAWEQLAHVDEEMVDVISAGGKVFSIGNERSGSGPLHSLHFCDDFTYNRPSDYEGAWGVRYRYDASGIEESRSAFDPPVWSATGIFRQLFKDNRGTVYMQGLLGLRGPEVVTFVREDDPSWHPRSVEPVPSGFYYTNASATDPVTNEIVTVGVLADTPSSETTYEIKLRKFAVDGTELWSTSYTKLPIVPGPFRGTRPIGIAIDEDGNIFVAAYNYIGASARGYPYVEQTLLKFSPTTGVLVASNSRNYGNAVDGRPSSDKITELVVDDFGNVFVTGETLRFNEIGKPAQPGTFVTKYNNSCDHVWTARQEHAIAERVANSKLALVSPDIIYHAYTHENKTYLEKLNGSSYRSSYSIDETFSELRDMDRDREGNIYLVKSSRLGVHEPRSPGALLAPYTLSKYNADCEVVWSTFPERDDTRYLINKMYIDNDHLYLAGFRQGPQDGGVTISYALDGLDLELPFWGVLPDLFLEPYYKFNVSVKATMGRSRSWTEAGAAWTHRSVITGEQTTYTAAVIENNKTVWQKTFKEPESFQLPSNERPSTFSLQAQLNNTTKELFSIDDNLVKNGVTEISMVCDTQTKSLNLKVNTDGASVPLLLSALNKDGITIWSKNFVAPLDISIAEKLQDPVAKLVLAAEVQAETSMSYYPNPSSGVFNVKISDEAKLPAEVTVYDMMGTRIYYKKLDQSRDLNIALSGQKSGLYILAFKNQDTLVQELIEIK